MGQVENTFFTIDSDLEGPAADELGLYHVAEEECHETGVDLILHGPCDNARSGSQHIRAQLCPGVEAEHDHANDDHLDDPDELGQLDSATPGVVVASLDDKQGDDKVNVKVKTTWMTRSGYW